MKVVQGRRGAEYADRCVVVVQYQECAYRVPWRSEKANIDMLRINAPDGGVGETFSSKVSRS